MPCSDAGYREYDERERERKYQEAVQVACELAVFLNEIYAGNRAWYGSISGVAVQWLKRHEEADRKRKEEEAEKERQRKKRDAALAKLTEDEKRILGV